MHYNNITETWIPDLQTIRAEWDQTGPQEAQYMALDTVMNSVR